MTLNGHQMMALEHHLIFIKKTNINMIQNAVFIVLVELLTFNVFLLC